MHRGGEYDSISIFGRELRPLMKSDIGPVVLLKVVLRYKQNLRPQASAPEMEEFFMMLLCVDYVYLRRTICKNAISRDMIMRT